MQTIEVSKLQSSDPTPPMEQVSALLDGLGEGHPIEKVNWESHPYRPEVKFNIAYGDSEIFIKYYVRESHVKAEKSHTNEMVCEDSCVEFFVAPADDGIYYNFEFNPIGTALVGMGHGRHDSARAETAVVDSIRRLASMGDRPFPERSGDMRWSLTLAIPISSFFHHRVESLKGKIFRANFYKCGDRLTVPHYVTWNPVETERPDYHRPEHFGLLRFV